MRRRADVLLVERGLFASRARAQEAIEAGLVRADGELVRKASQTLDAEARLDARPAHPWASRGGLKLVAALDAFGLDPEGRVCLDVGASTGGFTDVLLSRGARAVVAVDVGHGQFDPRLAADPRVRAARRPRRAQADAGRFRGAAGSDRLRRELHFAASRAAGGRCRWPRPARGSRASSSRSSRSGRGGWSRAS